ncbi:MAG TPA: sulfatase-like hydrolase/transferase [Acidobacteriota bacterium]|nr:sulfatase-like hydrolase/transferase [Acidobacteriota bacterium]
MPWLLPILYFVLDALFGRASSWNATQWGYYLLSLAASLALWFIWWRATRALRRTRSRAAAAVALLGGVIYGVNTVLVYGYVAFVGAMPNYYTFEFILDEPLNSWILLRDSLSLVHLLLFIPVMALFALWLYGRPRRAVLKPSRVVQARWSVWAAALFLIVAQLVLHNNARFVDQCFAADMTTTTSIARNISTRMRGQVTGRSGLLARLPRPLPDLTGHVLRTADGQPVNVLVILTESVRADALSIYGSPRPTSPFFDSLSVSDSSTTFLFASALSNASRTFLSMPSFVTGISPIQPARLLHTQPVIWEFFGALGHQTFFITSQSHEWRQMKNFFSVAGIGHLFNLETSGREFSNDMGINDRYTLDDFRQWLAGRDPTRGFAGILQFHCTHYPYRVANSLRVFPGETRRDNYDNSVRVLDDLIRDVVETLRTEGVDRSTLVVLTSDHGEEFKEHGIFGHVHSYYRNTLWIPMFWIVPADVQSATPTGDRMSTLAANTQHNVSNLDILPTLLDVFALDTIDDLQPIRDNYLGRSLFKPLDPLRPIIACNNSEVNRIPVGVTMVTGQWHYILNITDQHPDREELYDWTTDRAETVNVFDNADPALIRFIYDEFARYRVTAGLFDIAGVDLTAPPADRTTGP